MNDDNQTRLEKQLSGFNVTPLAADRMQPFFCDCGCGKVGVALTRNGEVFGVGSMTPGQLIDFAEELKVFAKSKLS